MLVLSRKSGQKTRVILPDGREGFIVVLRTHSRDSVKVGFQLPPDVGVFREEVECDLSESIAVKVAEIKEIMHTLLAKVKSLETEITNPQAAKVIADAKTLIGALDDEENTRKALHRGSDNDE